MASLPSPDSVLALIRARRTVHLFQQEAVDPSTVDAALDAARWAPNHRLTYPWRFYRLGTDTVARIVALNTEMTADRRGERAARLKEERWSAIPGWLVVTTQLSDDPVRQREDFAACCCAMQNMLLYLWSAGVATKWTTGDVTRDQRFYEIVGIPSGSELVVGLLWYGYAAELPVCDRPPALSFIEDRP